MSGGSRRPVSLWGWVTALIGLVVGIPTGLFRVVTALGVALTRPFSWFVAARYLMARPRHVSWVAITTGAITFVLAGVLLGISHLAFGVSIVDPGPVAAGEVWMVEALGYAAAGCGATAVFMVYLSAVRAFFTFYTTVSVVGVSVGGAALVTVLSVMNGFEGDLRHKILGSNAHIQISKEDGEFVEWEELSARIAKVPGVVASTPFATSEVVIAANSNYSPVVIKGIDVATAVKVTDLASNLVDPDGLDKLAPLVDEPALPAIEPSAPLPSDRPVLDPAPDDLPEGGQPIDYSGGDELPTTPDAKPASGRTSADGLTAELAGPDDFGGDAPAVIAAETVDPAPPDFAEGDDLDDLTPADLSGRAPPPRPTSGTSRIATLPGLLVGKELVKNIHVYPGQEVRVVSPLADPMNPDANGTPIPFNRDYRVAGEFFTGMYEYDLKLVYVSLESLQRFLRLGDAVDGIEVRIRNPDEVNRVVRAIAAEVGPEYRVAGWQELNRQLFSALKLEKLAMFLVLGIIILVASFSIVGNLIMIVIEKARQIALLKTLGASDVEIVGLFVFQGALIGLVGSLLGVTIGLGLCWYLATQGFPINPNVYYIDRLPVAVDPWTVAAIFGAGLAISILATIYPAALAAQLRPAAGLKKD